MLHFDQIYKAHRSNESTKYFKNLFLIHNPKVVINAIFNPKTTIINNYLNYLTTTIQLLICSFYYFSIFCLCFITPENKYPNHNKKKKKLNEFVKSYACYNL
jgi:hypothetical protein